MRYDTAEFSTVSSAEPGRTYRYVLTHDNAVTRGQLLDGLASSREGAYIDHYFIYAERK